MKSKGKLTFALFSACLFCASAPKAEAQSKLYPRLFDLQEVTLEGSVFKQAMELNDTTLLEYDVDRLLTPFCRQAGIEGWEQQHPNFSNWGSGNFRLDGHVGGHYLSALALAYAASKDEDMRTKLKERMDYMVDIMDECQRVFDNNTDGLYGYIGGYPDNNIWTGIYRGDLGVFNAGRGNVPFYVMHKIYAGLRDAYVYGGNEKAKECFLKLCDWGVNLISNINDATLQSILDTEHGGINEMYADAYQMTGEAKYLEAAKRYSHQMMVTGMQTVNTTFLDNKHANTQVPKYIGFARIAQENAPGDATTASYRAAARNFWTEVVEHRTVALGGNSIAEHFLPANRSSEYITNPDGPESCNTNNMLKLTEDLFAENQDAKYADFYEYAMLNHILSTQNPHTGGYVYFTSMRPQHYRMYSQVNQGMWCCVGTGMENHSKYGEFIYAHSPENDTLFVNLFVASKLDSEHFGLTQETGFPYDEQTTLTIDKPGTYVLAVRHPDWCKGDYKIRVNGTEAAAASTPGSYAYLSRTWAAGDKIEVSLPMELSLAACPNYDSYVAFRYGPVLLGAETGTENLAGQFAGEGRMDHCPSLGAQLSLTSAPMLIGERDKVLENVEIVDKSKLHFKIKPEQYNSDRFADLVLRPFFTIHECRYMMYWQQMTQTEWDAIKDEVMAEEEESQTLQERTLDFIATGEQQSDAGHVLQGEFEKGSYSGEFYVDALAGKWFSYVFSTQGVSKDVSLMCRYHSADHGRVYTIYVNDKELRQITLEKQNFTGFYNVEYPIPEEYLKDEYGNTLDEITVKFAATGNTPTPGIYYLRLLKGYSAEQPYQFVCSEWVIGDPVRTYSIEYDTDANTMKVNGRGTNNDITVQLSKYENDKYYVTSAQKYLLARGTSLKTGNGNSYLWWLNGANHNSSIAPTYETLDENGIATFVWDITRSGLTDFMQGDHILLSDNGMPFTTLFGLTSSAADGTATLTDIGFYSFSEMVDKYPELAALNTTEAIAAKQQELQETIAEANALGANVGDGPFQIPQTAKTALDAAITEAGNHTTSTDVATLVAAKEGLTTAIAAYHATELNAPSAEDRFYIISTSEDDGYQGMAVTLLSTDTDNFSEKFQAIDADYAQGFTFEPTETPNCYLVSLTGSNGKQFLDSYTTVGNTEAAPLKVVPTTSEGIYQLQAADSGTPMGASDMFFRATDERTGFKLVPAEEASVTLNMTTVGWATLILPFNADIPEGLAAYVCNGTGETQGNATLLNLEQAETLEANTPYIIKGEGTHTFNGYGTATQDQYSTEHTTGTYSDMTAIPGSYVLQNQTQGVGFYKVMAGSEPKVKAYRAFMNAAIANNANILMLRLPDGEATSIHNMVSATDATVNVYDLNGILVRKAVKMSEATKGLQKGIYVVDGVKKAVK